MGHMDETITRKHLWQHRTSVCLQIIFVCCWTNVQHTFSQTRHQEGRNTGHSKKEARKRKWGKMILLSSFANVCVCMRAFMRIWMNCLVFSRSEPSGPTLNFILRCFRPGLQQRLRLCRDPCTAVAPRTSHFTGVMTSTSTSLLSGYGSDPGARRCTPLAPRHFVAPAPSSVHGRLRVPGPVPGISSGRVSAGR